jgi:hypothetical protein
MKLYKNVLNLIGDLVLNNVLKPKKIFVVTQKSTFELKIAFISFFSRLTHEQSPLFLIQLF